eukprot:scaffold808_cov370-Prasinococcus_capsulatus_cf.AAC.4
MAMGPVRVWVNSWWAYDSMVPAEYCARSMSVTSRHGMAPRFASEVAPVVSPASRPRDPTQRQRAPPPPAHTRAAPLPRWLAPGDSRPRPPAAPYAPARKHGPVRGLHTAGFRGLCPRASSHVDQHRCPVCVRKESRCRRRAAHTCSMATAARSARAVRVARTASKVHAPPSSSLSGSALITIVTVAWAYCCASSWHSSRSIWAPGGSHVGATCRHNTRAGPASTPGLPGKPAARAVSRGVGGGGGTVGGQLGDEQCRDLLGRGAHGSEGAPVKRPRGTRVAHYYGYAQRRRRLHRLLQGRNRAGTPHHERR